MNIDWIQAQIKNEDLMKKKNSLIFMHFLIAVLLSNHMIEKNMIHDIIDMFNNTILMLLYFISFNFI